MQEILIFSIRWSQILWDVLLSEFFLIFQKNCFILPCLSSYLLRITLPHKRCLQIYNSPRWMLCLVHLHPHYIVLNYNVNSNAARDRWYDKCRTNTSLWFVLMKSEVCISTQWFSFLKKYNCRTLGDHIIHVRGLPSARKKKGKLKTSLYCLTPLVRNSAKCFIIKSPKRRSKKITSWSIKYIFRVSCMYSTVWKCQLFLFSWLPLLKAWKKEKHFDS